MQLPLFVPVLKVRCTIFLVGLSWSTVNLDRMRKFGLRKKTNIKKRFFFLAVETNMI